MVVYIVMEEGYDFGICRGVFSTRKAAQEFKRLQLAIDRWDDLNIERWRIENIEQVRGKFKKLAERRAVGKAERRA